MSNRKMLLGLGAFALCFGCIAAIGCQGSEIDPQEAKTIAQQKPKNETTEAVPAETVDNPKNIKRVGHEGG